MKFYHLLALPALILPTFSAPVAETDLVASQDTTEDVAVDAAPNLQDGETILTDLITQLQGIKVEIVNDLNSFSISAAGVGEAGVENAAVDNKALESKLAGHLNDIMGHLNTAKSDLSVSGFSAGNTLNLKALVTQLVKLVGGILAQVLRAVPNSKLLRGLVHQILNVLLGLLGPLLKTVDGLLNHVLGLLQGILRPVLAGVGNLLKSILGGLGL